MTLSVICWRGTGLIAGPPTSRPRPGSVTRPTPTRAAAAAAIEFTIKKDLPGRTRELGDYFIRKLKSISSSNIRDSRGLGLMLAVELKSKNTPYLMRLLEKGIAPLPTGTTIIRFLPPLVVEKDDIDKTITAFEGALSEV